MPNREINKPTLYGFSDSGNCMKPKWTADFLGVKYDWVELDIIAGESRTPEFLEMSPAGQVPVLRVPGRGAIDQSNAIMMFIAEGEDSDLIPNNRFKRAEMMGWLFWEHGRSTWPRDLHCWRRADTRRHRTGCVHPRCA